MLAAEASADYELIDSGESQKLERFGARILSRPDPQALWRKTLPPAEWKKADGHFGSGWSLAKDIPERWPLSYSGLKFWIRPSSFKHVGIFPEQAANWRWLEDKIGRRSVEVLNLFGYTGGATLSCAKAGAKVVHVDGSKAAIAWARDNAELSGLAAKPIRWILDDAYTFVKREIKRGRQYDGIIMDPPAFGHGPKNELWKIEQHLLPLIDECLKILVPKPLFFLVNGYAAGYSATAYGNAILPLQDTYAGTIETAELAIKEKAAGRLLPAGICARWART
ncbi:MAG: class I SAM-dependent methyltransferase [Patescibacteria group bacterium]|nr:class I SAM-dependent methyltransferase [Patescibacteria group bacterium]MDE2172539.1 class I SAM-dependent methyltransferase [Patescibacteria group bacterium]